MMPFRQHLHVLLLLVFSPLIRIRQFGIHAFSGHAFYTPIIRRSDTHRLHHSQRDVTEHKDVHASISIPVISSSPSENNQNVMSRSSFLAASAMAILSTTTAVPSQSANAQPQPSPQPTTAYMAADNSGKSTSNANTREESISGFVAGAALSATKTVVKYPLDTATVRLQMPNSEYSIYELEKLFQGSYRGITTPLLSNIPGGAIFFAVKDATKEFLKGSGADLPRWASTSLAVLAASFPYWAVRNPSEVVKTRQQAGIEGYGEGISALEAFRKVREGSVGDIQKNATLLEDIGKFYVGYGENILYAFPADVIKFVAYENFSGGRKNLSPVEGAIYGAGATAAAQFLTTPLDVVRNRAMAKAGKSRLTDGDGDSDIDQGEEPSYIETLTTLAKEEGLPGLFAGVSPRVGKAIFSGAIQFATYEETKQAIGSFFQRTR